MAPLTLSEHAMQAAVIQWADLQMAVLPALELLYAVPNGARTAISVAKRLKAEGMRAGVPDLCLPVAARGAIGLYIEMKTATGPVSGDQKRWHAALRAAGHIVVVCRSIESAIAELREHALAAGQKESPAAAGLPAAAR